jgi:Na+/melibiose symporter-like transporter
VLILDTENKESRKRLENKIRKYLDTYVGGRKRLLLLAFLAAIMITFVNFHGFSESWAWEIAKTIISLNGIILGFIIVGVTLFFSERGYAIQRCTEIFGQHLKDALNNLKVVELSDIEKLKKWFTESIESATAEAIATPSIIPGSIIALSISIGLAFSLFGVNDATQNDIMLRSIFSFILSLSISFQVFGIYLTYKFIQDFVKHAFKFEMAKGLKKALEDFTKEVENIETKSKEKN